MPRALRDPLIGLCFCALMGTAWAGAGWTTAAHVAELTPGMHGRYVLRLSLDRNPSGCKDNAGFYQDYGVPGSEFMYRALLEALTAGKKVRVFVTGNCDLQGYAEISSVSILP